MVLNNLKRNNMNNNLEFENTDPSPDSVEDNYPRTNYGEGYYEEPKQETLEEVAEKLYPVVIKPVLDVYDDGVSNQIGEEDINENNRESFIDGAKWQAERMYSEEDMAESFVACWKSNVPDGIECKVSFKEWFKQFKKK
jgi:hypothetical protein